MAWRCSLLSIVLILSVASLHAAEFVVDQAAENASDKNPGTEDEPWLTVSQAAKTLRAGDTVLVKPGVYHEAVSMRVSGTPDQPITFRAVRENLEDRVIITGADRIEDWQACTSESAAGNPDFASIRYADIAWQPTRVVQGGRQLTPARSPNEGWWIALSGGTHDIVDKANLKNELGDLVGGSIWFWDVDTTSHGARKIASFDPAAGALTLDDPIYRDRVVDPGKDRYFLQNRVQLIDQPGEWAAQKIDGGTRLFVWPVGDGEIEASRRGRFVVELGSASNLVIDGFEIRHGTGHGIGSWTKGSQNVTVQNCIVHHNDSDGIHMRDTPGGTIRRNVVSCNYLGVSAGCGGGLVVENEIAWNLMDGLRVGQNDVTVRRNYLHDHVLWGHADNFQLFGGIEGMVFEDNLLINGGQQMMLEDTKDGKILGNMMVGCGANAVILGHGNSHEYDIIGNTIAFPGYGALSLSGKGYRVRGNVLVSGHPGPLFGYDPASQTQSDRNLVWHGSETGSSPILYNRDWNGGWEKYLADSGQDAHSKTADPLFANAPVFLQQMEGKRLIEFTKTRLYVRGGTGNYEVGDTVEIDFDGTARAVTAAGGDYIEIDPGLDLLPMHSGIIANWKDAEDIDLDLSLSEGSPGLTMSAEGGPVGSRIDIAAYRRGDFDGDGSRDLPVVPLDVMAR